MRWSACSSGWFLWLRSSAGALFSSAWPGRGPAMTATLFDVARDDGPVFFRGFTPDTSDDDARAAFVARFGVQPERIIRGRSVVLVGPVPAGAGRVCEFSEVGA